jgi:hypothetical protein
VWDDADPLLDASYLASVEYVRAKCAKEADRLKCEADRYGQTKDWSLEWGVSQPGPQPK